MAPAVRHAVISSPCAARCPGSGRRRAAGRTRPGSRRPGAVRTVHVHHGVERGERDRHVRGVGGDAGRAGAEDRQIAVHPGPGRAAGSGLALVARLADVVEVGAPGALQQVAADRCHVAELARTHRPAAPGTAPDSRRRTRGSAARSLLRTRGADAERAPSDPVDAGERQPGRRRPRGPAGATPSRIRSTRFVPPARKRIVGSADGS